MNDLKQRVRAMIEHQLREFKDKSNTTLTLIADKKTFPVITDLLLNDKRIELLLKRKKIIPIVVVPEDAITQAE